MMGWHGGGMGAGAWVFMGLFWVVLIAVITWLVVRLVPSNRRETAAQASRPHDAQVRTQESPVDLLDRTFAHGELDPETYQNHRTALLAARGGAR